MLDDSWDSASSPDVKKKTFTSKSNNQKLGSMDSKYNFPAPTSTKRPTYNDDSYDNDILFSPTNSQGSPSASPVDYKNRSYNFADSPAKDANADYLANFVTESADLEDSILGGLLGGGKKPVRQGFSKPLSPKSKLEPIDSHKSDYSPYKSPEKETSSGAFTSARSPQGNKATSRRSSPPKSYKASNFRSTSPFSDGLKPIMSDDDSDFPIAPAFGMKRQNSAADKMDEEDFGTKLTTEAAKSSFDSYNVGFPSPKQKARAQPSFDVTNDAGFFASLERDEELHASDIPVVKKFTDGLVRPKTSAGRDQLPPAGNNAPSTTAKAGGDVSGSETLGSNKTADKEDDKEKDDTAGLAFIPSFMEPGRQNRRRRQLDTSPGKTFSSDDFAGGTKGAASGVNSGAGAGGMPKLQDLDMALGLGGPTTGPKKTFVDPFSAVDKKMPQLEKQASVYAMDSDDSSSDDALLNRNRYGRKDSFVTTKPATGTTTNNNNNTQGASTVTKETSAAYSASSAFPPSSHAAPVTAPSRLSTFTPAKPAAETAPSVTATVPSQQAQSSVSGQNNVQNKAPVNLSDSFEELNLSPGGYKPTSQGNGAGTSDTAYSNASLASLPIISPTASFRISSTSASGAQSSGNKKAKESVSKQEFDEDSDDLDVSGIVRIDIEEDLLGPRSGINRASSSSLKSPNNSNKESNAANRPKSASRSPRASFTDAPVNPHEASRTASGVSSHAAHQSIRTNSPAGMLTAAVNNFDANDASHSRRNSASSAYARPTSPVQAKNAAVSTFQDGLVRDRSAVTAPVVPASSFGTVNSFSNSGYGNSFIPAESTYSGFAARRGRDDSITEVEESPQDDVRSHTVQQSVVPSEASAAVPAPAEYVPLDRAERESQIHRETENLKVRLSHPQPASFQHSVVHSLAEEREHYRILQDNNIRYVQEVLDQKRLIAHLESEISRLKDEANIKAHRNQEEMLYLKEKYEGEIRDIKIKNSIETESLERRQEESLSSLKKLHAHEIEAIKERYKSEEKFEQIAGQLRTTSGSIRFIEEQLQSKQRGVELIREGQIDARERLLADMEAKARERAELAEAEGYRLKGILSHMEHVVNSLREQGSEEKERLRQEHSRLQARQSAFEAERVAQQNRNMEELAYVKQRSKEVELELVKLTQEKQAQFEAIAAAQSKLDSERAEFNAFVASSKRALEQTEARLKEEDARVGRLRNEMLLEKTSLEDRRVNAIRDIEGAEELRAVLLRAQQENETEKEELRRISQSYKAASEELMQHQAELQEQQAALEERELALREGFAQMKLAAGELSRRESAIKDSVQFLDRKRIALDRADRESMENRLVSAANFREWSVRQSAETLPLPAPPGRFHGSSAGAGAGTGWGDQRGEARDGTTAEDVFNKYDVFGGSDGRRQQNPQPMRSSAEESYFQGVRNLAGAHRMSKSAEFDGGFDTHRGGNQSYFASTAPMRASSEKENLYAQVLQSQQQETPWIETFQSKLKQAFHQGGAGSAGGESEAQSRLPAEVRTAQMALRQSRGQLNRVTSSTLNVQRLLEEEGDFLKALQRNKTQPGNS